MCQNCIVTVSSLIPFRPLSRQAPIVAPCERRSHGYRREGCWPFSLPVTFRTGRCRKRKLRTRNGVRPRSASSERQVRAHCQFIFAAAIASDSSFWEWFIRGCVLLFSCRNFCSRRERRSSFGWVVLSAASPSRAWLTITRRLNIYVGAHISLHAGVSQKTRGRKPCGVRGR